MHDLVTMCLADQKIELLVTVILEYFEHTTGSFWSNLSPFYHSCFINICNLLCKLILAALPAKAILYYRIGGLSYRIGPGLCESVCVNVSK